jgi:hypothetical protein
VCARRAPLLAACSRPPCAQRRPTRCRVAAPAVGIRINGRAGGGGTADGRDARVGEAKAAARDVPSPFFAPRRAGGARCWMHCRALGSRMQGIPVGGARCASSAAAAVLRAKIQVPSAAADVVASGTRLPFASRQHPWPVPSRLPGACQLPWSAWRGAHATHSSPLSPAQQVHRWQGAPQAAGHQGRSQERAGHWRREEGAHTGLRWADGATRGRALPDPRFERAARELAQPPHAYRTP